MVALKLIKIFDMDNEKLRENCLKEVQLHQVCHPFLPFLMLYCVVLRPSEHC
jgi:hypothetical protein